MALLKNILLQSQILFAFAYATQAQVGNITATFTIPLVSNVTQTNTISLLIRLSLTILSLALILY